jgi:cytochrome c
MIDKPFKSHGSPEKSMNRALITLGILIMTGFQAQAIEAPSLSLGKTLFESTELGSKARSCATCHPQGKGLGKVGDFNDMELKDIINACLRDALGGKLISTDSQEMNALLAYVRTFQKTR